MDAQNKIHVCHLYAHEGKCDNEKKNWQNFKCSLIYSVIVVNIFIDDPNCFHSVLAPIRRAKVFQRYFSERVGQYVI